MHYKPLPNNPDYSMLPEHMWGPLERYYWNGIAPGSFLTSVLANEFMQAVTRADHINAMRIMDIAKFVYWHLPANCYGSPMRVASWIVKGGADGREPTVAETRPENEGSQGTPGLDSK